MVEVLNAVYEADFLGFSYGFRPGRSPHQALDALVVALRSKKVNWVLDADIRGFFDTIDHQWLLQMIQHRIADRRVLRMISKWLKAGVMEANQWQPSDEGTPQGAVISPLLANVYLHHVLDLWVNQWRKRHAHGEVIIVRYADDFILGFQHRSDAERFQEHLRARLAKFALQLHEGKTRLLEFGRYAVERRKQRGEGKAPTFNFPGFTHICTRKRRSDQFQILRQSMVERRRAKIQAIGKELRNRREQTIAEQGAWLQRVMRGFYGYHAVPGNQRVLGSFRLEVTKRWYRSLCRRSHKKRLNWSKMNLHARRWLPLPKVQHPYPEERFDAVRTRGKSPVR